LFFRSFSLFPFCSQEASEAKESVGQLLAKEAKEGKETQEAKKPRCYRLQAPEML
jgi:hypothetical protein